MLRSKEHSETCIPDISRAEVNKIITDTFKNAPVEETIPTVYKNTVLTLKDKGLHLVSNIPPYLNVKSVMYRRRRKKARTDKMAFNNAEEVVIPPDYEDFLLADFIDDQHRMLIFCSENGRNIMKTGKVFLCDGTFKKCPKPFLQLYVIFCDIGSSSTCNKVVPVVYVLLTNKKKNTYSIMFEIIKKQIPEWTPNKFITDFEQAAIAAINGVFPKINHHGCYYHFREKLRRRAKQLRLTDWYSKKIVRLCNILPLLPPSNIDEGWKYIQDEEASGIGVNQNLKKFMSYVKSYWMPKKNIWCNFGQRHRTTNTCEGWNGQYNRSFKIRPTTMSGFLKVIKDDSDFRAITEPLEKRKSCVKQKNEYIQLVQMQLVLGEINVPLFLEKMCNC